MRRLIEHAQVTLFFALHSTEGTCIELSERGFELVTRPGGRRSRLTLGGLIAAIAADISRA